jgi:hypothetical protein
MGVEPKWGPEGEQMRTRRLLIIFAASAALLFGLSSLAVASPVNNPNAELLTVDCAGEVYDVVTTGPAGHIQGQQGVGILMVGTIQVFVNDELVEEETFFERGKGVKNLVTCTWEEEFVDPESGATVRLEFEGQVLFAPRAG